MGCHLLCQLLIVTIPQVETGEQQNQGVTASSSCRGGGDEDGLGGGWEGEVGRAEGGPRGVVLLRE